MTHNSEIVVEKRHHIDGHFFRSSCTVLLGQKYGTVCVREINSNFWHQFWL